MRKYNCIAIVSMLIVFTSCKSSTSPNTGNSNSALTPPGVSSTLVYHIFEIDPTGAKVPGTDTILDRDTVIAIGIAQDGKSNVLQLKGLEFLPRFFSTFWNYDSNGDISYYNDEQGQPYYYSGWITVPLASKGKTSFLEYRKASQGFPTDSLTIWYTYAGTMAVTIPSGQVFQTDYFNYVEVDQSGNYSNVATQYFDSKTGILVRIDSPSQVSNGRTENGGRIELQSASLN
ncbi:MAG TPA: hypothetical protein VFX22_09955 [Candidatus Kapabacteria bacterium]|nr:hypothetical protein [Candidatus Kapabacteria bacterium]